MMYEEYNEGLIDDNLLDIEFDNYIKDFQATFQFEKAIEEYHNEFLIDTLA